MLARPYYSPNYAGIIRPSLLRNASRVCFRYRKGPSQPGDPSCNLHEPETPAHFIAHCPALSPRRQELLAGAPDHVRPLLPDITLAPDHFFNVMIGSDWMDDPATQSFIVDFLDQLHTSRNSLLTD